MKPRVAAILASLTVAAPAFGQGATLTADPEQACYREEDRIFLIGSGFTPNTGLDFSRDGQPLEPVEPILADAAGDLRVGLKLSGMLSEQRRFSYMVTDSLNPLNEAGVELLVTATEVMLTPQRGAPNRRLKIAARGFFGGRTLYAHILRDRSRRVRTLRVGRVRGACRTVTARRRLFPAGTPPGRYSIQFDTSRRYRDRRAVQFEYNLTFADRS